MVPQLTSFLRNREPIRIQSFISKILVGSFIASIEIIKLHMEIASFSHLAKDINTARRGFVVGIFTHFVDGDIVLRGYDIILSPYLQSSVDFLGIERLPNPHSRGAKHFTNGSVAGYLFRLSRC